MKLTGRKGSLTSGGVKVANLTDINYQESEGEILNQTMATVSLTAILETASNLFRSQTEKDLVITMSDPVAITITLDNSWIDSVSVPVQRDRAITQQVSATCYTTPTIA